MLPDFDRLIILAICFIVALATSCSANLHYQERVFKENVIINGNMNASQAACAWQPTEKSCAILASQGK